MKIQTEVDELGFFGEYGGQYVPETLIPAIIELKKKHTRTRNQILTSRKNLIII